MIAILAIMQIGKDMEIDIPPEEIRKRFREEHVMTVEDTTLPATFLGPRPLHHITTASGRISVILPHPTNPDVVYIGAAGGGVWKTTDRGITWQPLTDNGLSNITSGALAFDPTNPDIIYYGTGEQNYCINCLWGHGIFRSTDGGLTWTQIATQNQTSLFISRILIRPDDRNTLIVAGYDGITISTDGGSTWTRPLPNVGVTSLVMRSDNPDVLFAGVFNEGLYMSTDGGQTWNQVPGLPTSGIRRVQVAISESNPDILYVVFENTSGGLYGMYKSIDGGSTWTQLNPPDYLYPQGYYDNTIAVDPNNPDIVYAGGIYLYRTLDGGDTWVYVNGGYYDYHYLAFAPDGSLYIANDGGLWRIENPESSSSLTLTNLNEDLGITQIYYLDANPVDTSLIIIGTQDNGSDMHWRNWGDDWHGIMWGDGGDNTWRMDDSSVFYVSSLNLYIARGTWSWDDEAFTSGVISGGYASDRKCWLCGPIEADPSGSTPSIYVGTYRVWKSEDGGDNWTAISGDLTSGGYDVLSAIGLSQTGDTIYTGSLSGTMYVTFDAGTTWNQIFLPEATTVRDIWVNPFNASEVYVMVGEKYWYLNRIYHSTDAGATWSDISTGRLPDFASFWSLAVDFSSTPHRIFAGLNDGLYFSDDGGLSFKKVLSVPPTAVFDIDIDTLRDVIFAATNGRGVWKVRYGRGVDEKEQIAGEPPYRLMPDGVYLFERGTIFDASGRKLTSGKGYIKLGRSGIYILETRKGTFKLLFAG